MADSTDTGFSPSRRAVLKTGAAAGTLLLAFHMPIGPAAAQTEFAPNAFIRIAPDGTITLVMPQVEMGQGVYTAVAMILAEELDADFDRVVLEAAPPNDALYGNPIFGIQVTGNSNSIRAFWMKLRKAGAGARALLVQAAAQQWSVDPASCRTEKSEVIHDPSNRRLAYAALVARASGGTPPKDPPLKAVADFKLIGHSHKRLDTPEKVNGTAKFGIDMMPDGVKIATIAQSPVFGGKLGHVDDSAALKIPGVRQVLRFDDFIAVVGDHMWAAKQGLEALDISWVEGPTANLSTADIWQEAEAASQREGVVAKSEGDALKALQQGDIVEQVYQLPLLAHATMEPMNCTVHVQPDSCEVWVGSQVVSRAQAVAAKVTGLPPEKVTVHNQYLGGGFGRRLEIDYVESAVQVARHVDGPVKVIWTREEDMQHDVYRPVYYDRISATLANGRIDGWKHRITGAAIIARWLPPAFQHGIDIDAVDSAVDMPYDIPNKRIEYVRREVTGVPTGFWRGVGPNNNVFAIESFMDEMAKKAGKNPVTFRLSMLDKSPRLKAAVELAANKAGWLNPLPSRTGRGICAQVAFGSFIATVVEAEVDEAGEVHLRRVTSCVDTGIAVNPDTIVAQLQGGLIFGLTAALYGEITIENGRVQQTNFNDYRMLRINQTPAIDVHLIRSGEAPGGIGETGTTAGPPALVNAIAAATGVRLRKLPIDRNALARSTQT